MEGLGCIVDICRLLQYFEECENHTYDETENGRLGIGEEDSETSIDPIGDEKEVSGSNNTRGGEGGGVGALAVGCHVLLGFGRGDFNLEFVLFKIWGGEKVEEESSRANIWIVGGVGLLENVEECREFQARDAKFAKFAVGEFRTSSGANPGTQGKWKIVSGESLMESTL